WAISQQASRTAVSSSTTRTLIRADCSELMCSPVCGEVEIFIIGAVVSILSLPFPESQQECCLLPAHNESEVTPLQNAHRHPEHKVRARCRPRIPSDGVRYLIRARDACPEAMRRFSFSL